MSNEIIKVANDMYVVWYDEGPGVWGTREEIEPVLLKWEREDAEYRIKREMDQRFERTDRWGRSSMIGSTPVAEMRLSYYDPTSKQSGFVPGARLKEFLDSHDANNGPTFDLDIVQPYPDEDQS